MTRTSCLGTAKNDNSAWENNQPPHRDNARHNILIFYPAC